MADKRFDNKVPGEDVSDFSLTPSNKAFQAPMQDVPMGNLKEGLTGSKGFTVESDDKFDRLPRGHDRA